MTGRGTTVCAVACALLFAGMPGPVEGATFLEPCTSLSVRYHRSIKDAVTVVNGALVVAQNRMSAAELSLVGTGTSLGFLSTPLADLMNRTSELSNQLDEANDVTLATLVKVLPYGISVGCQVDISTADLYLTLAVNASGVVSASADLSLLAEADVAGLGLAFAGPADSLVTLGGETFVSGTVGVKVLASGTVVSVTGLTASVSAAGTVATSVAWRDVSATASVGVSGSVDLTGVTIPVEFPADTASLAEWTSRLGEVRFGTVAGTLSGALSVDVAGAVGTTPVGQLPSPVLRLYDADVFDAELPVVTVDADMTALESTFVELLRHLGSFDIDLGVLGLSGLELPGVNVSALVSGVPDMLKLAPVAEQYFLLYVDGASVPTFSGLVDFLKDNLPAPQLTSAVSVSGVNVTGGWFPAAGEVALNIRMELESTLASDTEAAAFGGCVASVFEAVGELEAAFSLIGGSLEAGKTLEVPDFSADVGFRATVVLDVTVGLKTEFVNTGTLTGSALAGNAFVRVNDLSADVAVTLDPVDFSADLMLGTQFVVRGGTFEAALGVRANFNASEDEEDVELGAAVSASTVAAVTEITVLELLSGGTGAVLDFVAQLSLTPYASLDVVLPVALTAGFAGTDVSLAPVLELHDANLLSGGLPAFSLDIDLSFLVPTLPGGGTAGGTAEDVLTPVMAALSEMVDKVADVALPTASVANFPSIGGLLSGLAGQVSFSTVLAEYLDLLVKFRELENGLGLDLVLETVGAEALVTEQTFNENLLVALQARFPTVFGNFSTSEPDVFVSSYDGSVFTAVNYLAHVQVEFGLVSTLASADATFGQEELVWYLAVNPTYALAKDTAWALVNLLGASSQYVMDPAGSGYPVDATTSAEFNPGTAENLAALQAALGVDGTFTLATLGKFLANSAPTLGVNVNFNKAVFELLVVSFPDLGTTYSGRTVGDLLPTNPVTGATFDWRNYVADVGAVFGLGTEDGDAAVDVAAVAGLFGKRPTLMGCVRYLKARMLHGALSAAAAAAGASEQVSVSASGSTSGLSFSADLVHTASGRWELGAKLGLALDTGAMKPTDAVKGLEGALSGLFDAIGEDSVVASVGSIGSVLETRLAGLDDFLSLSAVVAVGVEAGLDLTPLVEGTAGSATVFVRVLEFNLSVTAGVADYAPTLDFGSGFSFGSVVNTDLVFSAVATGAVDASTGLLSSPIVLADASTPLSLAPLVAALEYSGSVVAEVELSGALLGDSVSVFVSVEDLALFDDAGPKYSVDVEIPGELMAVVRDVLGEVGDVGRSMNEMDALTTTLPLVNRTLHDLLKVGETGPQWGDFLEWDTVLDTLLAKDEYTGCLSGGDAACPRARETVTLFSEAMANLTQNGSFSAGGGVPAAFVNGGMVGDSFELAFGVAGSLEVHVTPPLAELIDDDDFDFTGTGLLTVKVDFAFGFEVKVDASGSGGAAGVSTADVVLQLHEFSVAIGVVADVTATASIGILSASVEDGSGALAASFDMTMNKGAPVTLAELLSLGSAEREEMFEFKRDASLSACLPFSASIGSQDLGELSGATGDKKPQVCVEGENLLDGGVTTVTTEYMDRFMDFRGMSPLQMMGVVRALINVLQEYRESAVFDLPLPFTDVDVGDMLDFSETLATALSKKMVRVQDAADRTNLVLCLEGDVLMAGWNVAGSDENTWFAGNESNKVMSLVLNEQLEVEVALDTAVLAAAADVSAIAVHMNEELYKAGLGLSVAASVAEDGTDALQLCTNASIKATDLRVQVALKKTGITAYNESEDAVAATTLLGFTSGDIKEAPRVPAFSSIPELVVVLAEAVGVPSELLSYTYAPSAEDASQYELLFALNLEVALPTPMTSLMLGAEVEPLFSVNASAEIELTTDVAIGFEVGVRMGTSAGNLSVTANIPAAQGVASFELQTAQSFQVVLDRVPYTIALRAGEEFYTELAAQLQVLNVTLEAAGTGQQIRSRNYQDTTFLIQTLGVRRLEVVTSAAFEELTGLASDGSKALLFAPVVRDMGFTAEARLSVTEVNMAATMTVLEAEAYSGSGAIEVIAKADFGTPGETMMLSEIRAAIVEDPFEQIAASATLTASLSADFKVGVPSLGSLDASVAVALDPTFVVELKKDFKLPNVSTDFTVDVTGPKLPDFQHMSAADIVALVADGVDMIFGNEAADPAVEGLLTNVLADVMDVEIPLISFTPRTMVSGIQSALGTLEGLLTNQTGAVSTLELLIEDALGLVAGDDDASKGCTGSCMVEFSMPTDGSALMLSLSFEAVPKLPELSLDMDLQEMMGLAGVTLDDPTLQELLGDFLDLDASLDIVLSGGAAVTLELGVDLSSKPFRFFVGGETALQVSVGASAIGSLELSLGPLKFGITDATIALTDGTDAEGPAYLRYGLSAGSKYYLDEGFGAVLSAFELTSAGKITAMLPIDDPIGKTMGIEVPRLADFLKKDDKNGKLVEFVGEDFGSILSTLADSLRVISPIEAILKDPTALLSGIKTVFSTIDALVTGEDGILGTMDVPIVGSKLREVISGDFVDSFVESLLSELGAEMTGETTGSVARTVKELLESFFGDLNILKGDSVPIVVRDKNGDPMENLLTDDGDLISGQGTLLNEADAVEWDLTIGKDIDYRAAFAFGLGLEELPLSLNAEGGIVLNVGWEFKLFFGLSVSRGFYLNVKETEMEVSAEMTLPQLKATGDLFILNAAVENYDSTTKLVGSAAVDITDTNGDGWLTFKELKSGGTKLLSASADFEVVLGMEVTLGLAGEDGLPEFVTSLYSYYGVPWSIGATAGPAAGVPTVPAKKETLPVQGPVDDQIPSGTLLLLDVHLDLGEFVTRVLNPIFGKLAGFLGPIRPILEALQKPLPVVSDLAGRDVSLLELPEILINGLLGAGGPVRGSVKNVLAYVSAISDVIDLALAVIDVILELGEDDYLENHGSLKLAFGNWKIDSDGFAAYPDGSPLPQTDDYASAGRAARALADDDDDDTPVAASKTTGSTKMKNLMAKLTDPEAIFQLPFLSAKGVLGLITGEDTNLFVVTTPTMEIDVTIDFWLPLAGIIVIDFYGSFQFRAGISMGYDTSGIRRAIEQGKPELALDGFFLSDTDDPVGAGGNDIPELYASGVVRVGATLNLLLARLSGSGELSFTGSIDLYDPNDDGKIRFSEIKSIIDEGSFLDIFNIKIKMCAGATFSVDLFNPFVNWKCKWYGCWPHGRWESVWKFSVHKCFLELDTTPPALPVLAAVLSDERLLRLNMGTYAGARTTGDTADSGETFTIRHVNGASPAEEVEVLFGVAPAAGQDDNRQAQEYTGFSTYYGEGNKFSDTVLLVNPVSSGHFIGGDDDGFDRLVLDFSSVVSDLPAGTLSDGLISGFGLGGVGISYSGFEEVSIYLNGQANLVTVTGSRQGCAVTLYLNGGNDKVVVTAGTALAGNVRVEGGDGQDTLYVLSTVSGAGRLEDGQVSLPDTAGVLSFEASTLEVLRVTLTGGADTFVVAATPPVGASVEVQAAGGADTITVGSGTLVDVTCAVKVSGSGEATFVVDDSADTTAGNVGEMTTTRVTGLGMSAAGVVYTSMAAVQIKLAVPVASVFTVSGTHAGTTHLYGGGMADTLTVADVSGETWVYAGEGADSLVVPPTEAGDEVTNRIAAVLHLDGEEGSDTYNVGFSGAGTSRIVLSDAGWWNGGEDNELFVAGTPADDTFLFRTNFIALLHADVGVAERLDVDRTINGGITVNGLAGDDSFVTDGTAGIVTQNGGAGDDRFLIGQMYNSLRVEGNMSEPEDAFDTTLTTEGYLSDGNGEHMNCNGESGEDTFVVMRNVATLSLRGGTGDDRFTVRAFALWDADDQAQPDPALGQTDVGTDEGDDVVYYTVNAPVTIDGGPGFDTLVAIGTEFPDTFVVTRDGIYGSGLYITFVGIESVELNTAAGDDTVYVMSTAAHVQTSVFAGLGSDTVYVTPRYSVPVQSSDLRGHNGIVEHAVSSATDAAYDGLEAHGVTAYVTDQDNASLAVVMPKEIQLVEGSWWLSAETFGFYHLRMGRPVTGSGVNDSVRVTIVVPGAPSEIPGAASVQVFPSEIEFTSEDWSVERTVYVGVVSDSALEGNEVVFLGHAVVQISNLDGYDSLKIPSVPVRVIDADQAELYVLETPDTTTGMRISEDGAGLVGTSVTYEVLLRPCVAGARPQDVTVTVEHDAAQVTVSPATFAFDASGSTSEKCRQTVTVTAVDDTAVEGFHFVALQHTVAVEASNAVFAGAALAADAVNVEILDDDAPALVVLESEGSTEVIEGMTTDTYVLYLTQVPVGEVTVDVTVVASEIWGGGAGSAAKQVSVSPTQVVFGAGNYSEAVTVTVTPVADGKVDLGETTQQFASQPALAYQIQGALSVGGGEAEGAVTTLSAVMYPGEVDIEVFPGQTNEWLTVREEQQVDRLVVENTGGFLPTTVELAEGRITGMGMGESRVLAGTTTVLGGVTYDSFEEVVVNLGPAVDTVVVNGTHAGATYVNAGKGDDTFAVLAADGPVVLNGSDGADAFTFGDEAGLLSGVRDVVCVDGGDGTDTLWVKNTGGNPAGEAGFLTRTELTGLGMYPKRDSSSVAVQVVAVRGTGGTFGLTLRLDDAALNVTTGAVHTFTFAVGTSADAVEAALQAAVYPPGSDETCGTAGIGPCVHSFAVDALPWGYLVRYVGELAVEGTVLALELDTADVVGNVPELLLSAPIDSRTLTAGALYVGVETLDVDLSVEGADTLNIRGTSVPTTVRSHAGDDTFVVGSDAMVMKNVDATTVEKVDGRLDYVEALLTLDGGDAGRTRLLVSDNAAAAGKGAVELSKGLIHGLAPADIVYTGADYTRGISLWLSAHADTVLVSSTAGSEDNNTADLDLGETRSRTITQLFTGDGADTVTVVLADTVNGFFVVGTEDGDDTVNASASTLPLVIVGGDGDDTVHAGQGADIIFGDTGNLVLGEVDTVGVPAGSTAALSGALLLRSRAYTDHEQGACASGGADTVLATTGTAAYTVFGGDGDDTVRLGSGADVVFADYGFAMYAEGELVRAETGCAEDIGGADVVETAGGADMVFGGSGTDTVSTADGDDLVVADHGSVLLEYPSSAGVVVPGARLVTRVVTTLSETGAADTVHAGDGADVVVGGVGADTVWAGAGDDVVFGDAALYTSSVAGDFAFASAETDEDGAGTGDVLYGEDGDDILVGGQGDDELWGAAGNDWLFGDHGAGSVTPSVSTEVTCATAAALAGGVDTLHGEDGHDVLMGGHADDTLFGGPDSDVLFGDYGVYTATAATAVAESADAGVAPAGANTIAGETGDDFVFGGSGADTVVGGLGADWVFGDNGRVAIEWGAQAGVAVVSNTSSAGLSRVRAGHVAPADVDMLTTMRFAESTDVSDGAKDVITGDDGDDVVFGGAGGDALEGNDGVDVIFGDHGSVLVKGTEHEYLSTNADVEANGGDDNITGNNGDDFAFGGQGADTMSGEEGNDVIFGDHGKVTLQPDQGVRVYESVDTAHGAGGDAIVGDAGDDTLFGGAGGDALEGNDGVDVIFGDHGSVLVNGTEHEYLSTSTDVEANGGDDHITGNNGDDFAFGGQGADTMSGEEGNDVIFGDHGKVTLQPDHAVHVYESVDTAHGAGGDAIVGDAGDDTLFGGAGGDALEGNDGADVIFGDHGSVLVNGTEHEYLSTSTDVEANGGDDNITGNNGDDFAFGGQGADTMSGEEGNDVIFGDHGKVTLQPDQGVRVYESVDTAHGAGGDVIVGDAGDDTLFGGSGGDMVAANSGNDVVFGDHGRVATTTTTAPTTNVTSVHRQYATVSPAEGGDDWVEGAEGDDLVFGGFGADNVTGDAGADWVFGDHGVVNVWVVGDGAGAGAAAAAWETSTVELLSADVDVADTGADDTIVTHAGDDVVLAGPGDDTVHTGDGADVVFGDNGNVTLVRAVDAGTGAPTWVREYSSTDVDAAYAGDDVVLGGAGDDVVIGGNGADTLSGEDGEDWVVGDHGRVWLDASGDEVLEATANASGAADTVLGGDGDDYLMGGVDADRVEGGAGHDIVFGDSGRVTQAADSTVGVRRVEAIFTATAFGGADTLLGGSGDDVLLGQQGGDHVSGNDGLDMVFGDQAVAELARGSRAVLWAETTVPHFVDGRGGDDELHGNDGEDYLFGGTGSDTLFGGDGMDVLLGDHALFNASFPRVHQYRSIFTGAEDEGANDTLHGDAGDDMLLGQQGDDLIYGGAGEDDITGGHDVLYGSDGDDTIFGGSEADVVLGDNGVITRKIYIPKRAPVAPARTPSPLKGGVPSFCHEMRVLGAQTGHVQHPEPAMPTASAEKDDSDSSDSDSHSHSRSESHSLSRPKELNYGPNEHKCWETACAGGSVHVSWEAFATEAHYDTVSLYSVDVNGTLALMWEKSGWEVPAEGVYTEDVLVRFSTDGYTHDRGFALTYTCAEPTPTSEPVPAPTPDVTAYFAAGPPYVNAIRWERYPSTDADADRFADIVRLVQRFDDVDLVGGADTVDGGDGDDIVHGQRGDDDLQGGAGDDEVFGEQGSDVVAGGPGADVLLGDMGHVVRAFLADGTPRVNVKTGAWHRNVVLEEQARLTDQWVETSRDAHFWPTEASALLRADVLVAMGGYTADGTTKLVAGTTRAQWRTVLAGLHLVDGAGHDTLRGEGGDDVLFGQRGDDVLDGGSEDDFVYGDRVSSVYHYDSCLPLVTTVVRVLRGVEAVASAEKTAENTRAEAAVEVGFFGKVVHVPMWLEAEESSRAAAMRPVDDAALATLVPEDMAMMLDAVGAGDFVLNETSSSSSSSSSSVAGSRMRPMVAVVPDVARHSGVVYGNDELLGGDGNDVVVGDAAFHHALVNLRVGALDEMRARTAGQWSEVQFRLARMSVDAGTLDAQTGTALSAANVSSGNDRLDGGAGNDTLVGDRLEALTDVVYHEHFGSLAALEAAVKGMMHTYADFEVLAVDVQHALFEAHHAVVQSLLFDWRRDAVRAADVVLALSNDVIAGGDGNDVAVGDSLVVMTKGLFLNHTHSGNFFTGAAAASDADSLDERPFTVLLAELGETLAQHIRVDFHPSDSISGGNLKRRDEWNSLPATRWGCDTVHGDAGDDSVLGDFGLVVVATFEGAPFHPSTVSGLRSMNTALGEHLDYVEHVLQTRLAAETQTQTRTEGLSMYADKGRGVYGHTATAGVGAQSDVLFGDAGADTVSGSNGVAVVPMWRQTNTVVVDAAIEVRRSFLSVLDGDAWARLHEYAARDRTYDQDVLSGGAEAGERDVLFVENVEHDTVVDKEHWVDSVYYRPAYAYISGALRDTYVGAVHNTCLNELALDGVVASAAVHTHLDLPVYGWHGIFGVVWGRHGVREPEYYLDRYHHVHHWDADDHHHTTDNDDQDKDVYDCGDARNHDSWDFLCNCLRN